MIEYLKQSLPAFQLARDWFLAQPLPIQVVAGAATLAVLWVSWLLLRVVLVAFRAAFRGL